MENQNAEWRCLPLDVNGYVWATFSSDHFINFRAGRTYHRYIKTMAPHVLHLPLTDIFNASEAAVILINR